MKIDINMNFLHVILYNNFRYKGKTITKGGYNMKNFIKATSLVLILFLFSSSTAIFADDASDKCIKNDCAIPTSDVYKEGIYRFDITCTKCVATAKYLTPNTSGVIIVINADNTERLFKKCTVDNPDVEIGSLTKDDTVVIIGKGEFEILFTK